MNIDFTLAGAVIITGLIVVFIALVGLWLIVWLFGKLFVTVGSSSKPSQPKKQAPTQTKSAAQTASSNTAVKNAMVIEDEVVAVIAAAVAAMGSAAGGFAVRSVRRVKEARSAWTTAGLAQNTQPF